MATGSAQHRTVKLLLLSGAFLLSACDGGFKMGSIGQAFKRAPAETAPARPAPDDRGVITYATYQVVVAKSGDAMSDVAGRVGMDAAALAKYNGLPVSYIPRGGEVMALPKGVIIPTDNPLIADEPTANSLETIASSAIGRADSAKPTGLVQSGPEPIRHTAEPGETAYSIARLYGVSVTSLASWNGLDKDLSVRPGQRLLVPVVEDGTPKRVEPIAETAPGQGSVTPLPPSSDKPLPPKVVAEVVPESPNLAQDRTPPGASRKLLKPVSGNILRGYSNAPGGNEGLDIAAKVGTNVKAAEDGEVALVSNSAGNTKIVLLRHPDNLYTVYSNVTGIPVSKGQTVRRGQTIGTVAGGTPSFLHFEIRRGTESVDPAPYL